MLLELYETSSTLLWKGPVFAHLPGVVGCNREIIAGICSERVAAVGCHHKLPLRTCEQPISLSEPVLTSSQNAVRAAGRARERQSA